MGREEDPYVHLFYQWLIDLKSNSINLKLKFFLN